MHMCCVRLPRRPLLSGRHRRRRLRSYETPMRRCTTETELRRMRSRICITKPSAGVLAKYDRIVAKELGFSRRTMEGIRADKKLQELCTKDAWKTPDFVIDGVQQWWARQLLDEQLRFLT